MNKKELIKRTVLLILGLLFAGIGVAFTKHGQLGVSPVSSVANVLSIKFTFLSLGNWLIVWNCFLIALQILILRRDFKLFQFLQIPISFLFGYFTDFGMWLVSPIPVNSYAMRLVMLIVGVAVLGFGVSLSVMANLVMNSGEAVVKAVSDKWKLEFGNVKIGFDVACVLTAVALSLIFFDFKLVGTREGTIISALTTGLAVKYISKLIRPTVEKFIG